MQLKTSQILRNYYFCGLFNFKVMTSKDISNYIYSKSIPQSINKGRQLYDNAAIQAFKIYPDEEKITAIVQGDMDVYSVKIFLKKGKISGTTCTCPYDFGGICKHTVATLYHLGYHLNMNPNTVDISFSGGQNSELPPAKMHSSNDWYNLGDSKNLSVQLVRKMFKFENIYNNELQFKTLTVNKLDVIYIVRREQSLVRFEHRSDGLFTKCDCTKAVSHLCPHQGQVLLEILTKYASNFLEQFMSENLEQKRMQLIKKFGLPEKFKFESFFSLQISDRTIDYHLLPSVRGLMPVEDEKGVPSIINQFVLSKTFIETLAEVKKDAELFKIGFCIASENSYNRSNDTYKILPITGKLSKDGSRLINPIRTLYDYNSISGGIDDTQEQIVRLTKHISSDAISEYLKRTKIESYSDNAPIAIYNYTASIYRQLFPLLAQEEYTYFTSDFYQQISAPKLEHVTFCEKPVMVSFRLSEDEFFLKLDTIILFPDLIESEVEVTYIQPFMLKHGTKIAYIENELDAKIIMQIQTTGSKNILITKDKPELLIPHLEFVTERYKIETVLQTFETEDETMIPKLKQIYITESGRYIFFEPIVEYDNNKQINILRNGEPVYLKQRKFIRTRRDEVYEAQFKTFVKSLHPEFEKQHHERFFYLQAEHLVKDGWFFEMFEILKSENVEVFGFANLKNFKYSPHKAKVSTSIQSGQDWFDIEVEITYGDMTVSLKDVQKAIKKGENFVRLADGSLGLLPEEWLKKLKQYLRIGHIKSDNLKISKLHFSVIDELFDEQDYLEVAKEIYEKKQKLKNFSEIKDVVLPVNLLGEMRDYQKAGFNWLNFLQEFSWGGILADDMGLGKTIQVLAFLLKQKEENKKANLVIVPTSLLFNWKNEIEKFTPTLKAVFHHGLDRMKDHTEFKNYNMIVTSYGIMARDIEMFRKYEFNYVILDESQAIKNPSSQRFKATTLLRAKHKLTLTGTPIENNTFDLYAQMEFLNPGFLGSQAQFKENYSDPIDKNSDVERATELQHMINPFIMRRTKEQVAKELPPKIEDFIYCEMQAEQRKVYDAFRNKYRDYLIGKIDENGMENSKLYVLEGLTKLRQICDSPELLNEPEFYGTDSVKIRELVKHITEKTGKHKLLIFSQFVKMLTVIRRELEQLGIAYDYLDGQSTQIARQQSVEHFQTDNNTRVFLISLKAGGTGLNLTAADYVYIVDPWWNPAVENQAIDRAYRIGQDKHVIAYRMICSETIEEKIMNLQAKKKKIAGDIISTDEGFIKNLTKADIEELFG